MHHSYFQVNDSLDIILKCAQQFLSLTSFLLVHSTLTILCFFRYWKDKILPSARKYDDNVQVTLDSEVKAAIFGQIKEISQSPVETIYYERLAVLYKLTSNVYVKASQYAMEFESFEDVFTQKDSLFLGLIILKGLKPCSGL